jgi:hypothetical protein
MTGSMLINLVLPLTYCLCVFAFPGYFNACYYFSPALSIAVPPKNIKDDEFSYQLYPLELWANYLSKVQASQETLLHPFLE